MRRVGGAKKKKKMKSGRRRVRVREARRAGASFGTHRRRHCTTRTHPCWGIRCWRCHFTLANDGLRALDRHRIVRCSRQPETCGDRVCWRRALGLCCPCCHRSAHALVQIGRNGCRRRGCLDCRVAAPIVHAWVARGQLRQPHHGAGVARSSWWCLIVHRRWGLQRHRGVDMSHHAVPPCISR